MSKGLNEQVIIDISKKKHEPKWMLDFRLASFQNFNKLPMPSFGPKINLDFKEINYYKKVGEKTNDWSKADQSVKKIFGDLGIINAEEKYLDGVSNQLESEVIYHHQQDKLSEQGIIFMSTDEALQFHPELFQKYFNHLVQVNDNKFVALNSALWSGGTFIYLPPHTKLDRPLQSYFRINSASLGQFERTIIIVDDDSELSYIEGCTALSYATSSLHAGVVEIYVGKRAKCRYTTIQNWSMDVYNLVTKRAIVEEDGQMEWIDGNIGSKVTMKYPACILKGDRSVGNSISIAYAKNGQYLDVGAKMIHLGKNTKSNILSKSIASTLGTANYRGTTKITKEALDSTAFIKCDTILLDDTAKSMTYPTNINQNTSSNLAHEASVSKVNEEQLWYLLSKGLSEEMAKELLIMGFIADFKKELPMEYAVELNRLLKNDCQTCELESN